MENRKQKVTEEVNKRRRKNAKIRAVVMLTETALILVLIIALIVLSVKYNEVSSKLGSIKGSVSVYSSVDTVENGGDESSNTDHNETDEWYLKLVNPDSSVDKDFINSVTKAEIDKKFISGSESSKYIDSRIVDSLNQMCKAADKDGVDLVIVSAYRTYSYQETLYKNRVKRCMNEDGLSEAEAKVKAATIVALPGTSEHHLGLAVDINSVSQSFEETKAFKWLSENAADYGFIMRYPEDKKDITKIIYEPWHYRYVGVQHAKAMNSLNLCLEEYINYLNNGGAVKK
jgi:D-alanyl-D-alanine carboxypeptidase